MDMAAGQEFQKFDEDGNPIESAAPAGDAAGDAADEMSEMSMSSDEEDDEAEIFPEWLEVQVSHTSRAMMLQWARWARWNLKIKEEEKIETRRAAMAKERARETGVVDVNFLTNAKLPGKEQAGGRGTRLVNNDSRFGDDMGINIDGEDDPDMTPIDR